MLQIWGLKRLDKERAATPLARSEQGAICPKLAGLIASFSCQSAELPFPADCRRVDSVIASATTAIARSRRSSIILAFSVATANLLGAVAAWAAATAGGRHRDGAPLPEWIERSNTLGRRRTVLP